MVTKSRDKADLTIIGPRQKIELRNRDNILFELEMGDTDFSRKEGRYSRAFELGDMVIKGLDYDISLMTGKDNPLIIEVEVALYTTKQLYVLLFIRAPIQL